MKCKGLFYRFRRNFFLSKRGDIILNESFKLLKRKSCKGCATCGADIDYIKEANGDISSVDVLKDGDIVTTHWEDTSTFEEVDAELYFRKVRENEK